VEDECRPVRSAGSWDDAHERRAFMDKVAAKHGVARPEDWKKVSNEAAGGATLLRRFNSSVIDLLRAVYPEREWEEREVRPKLTREYWSSAERRKAFLLEVAEKHGLVGEDGAVDWRRLTYSLLLEERGTGLLARYGSVMALLQDTFPDLQLEAGDCLLRVPAAHWQEHENRRKFVESLAEELGLERPEDWKRVSMRDVQARGGAGLLAFHGQDMVALLRDAYGGSEEEWVHYNCRRNVRSEHWEETDNVREFVAYLAQELHIQQAADWGRVSRRQLTALGASGLLQAMPLEQALRTAYPDEKWEEVQLDRQMKKSGQWRMRVGLARLYPGVELVEDYRHPSLGGSEDERRALELDIYFPQLQLAFEYNGQQHYHDVGFFGPVEVYRRRDQLKRELCRAQGIRLVTLPYWWDERLESLAATIEEQAEGALPVPRDAHGEDVRRLLAEVAAGAHEAVPSSPPALASAPQRATTKAGQATHVWDSGRDPAGMLASRHLAGVRAFWTEDGQLATRRGKRLFPPASWRAQMPANTAVEGDLYAGQASIGAVLQVLCEGPAWAAADERLTPAQLAAKQQAWSRVRFVACDAPAAAAPLSARLEALRSLAKTEVFSVAAVEEVEDAGHLGRLLDAAAEAGDEGLLLRYPRQEYRYGRVQEAHRLKKLHHGRAAFLRPAPSSRAFLVETPAGAAQAVRCSAAAYAEPPRAGTVLEVGHFGTWRTGRYKHPFLVRALPDERWTSAA